MVLRSALIVSALTAAAVGCVGHAVVTSNHVLLGGLESVGFVTAADGWVYFSTEDANGDGLSTIERAAETGGGYPQVVVTGVKVDELAVDATRVYFVDTNGGSLSATPLPAGAASPQETSPTTVASGLDDPIDLTVTANAAYVVEQASALVRVPLDGSASSTVTAGSPGPMVGDGSVLYFANVVLGPSSICAQSDCVTEALYRLADGDGTPTVLFQAPQPIAHLALDHVGSIYAAVQTTSSEVDLFRIPVDGSGDPVGIGAALPTINTLAATPDAVQWISGYEGPIWSMPGSGGEPAIFSFDQVVGPLVSDGSLLFGGGLDGASWVIYEETPP